MAGASINRATLMESARSYRNSPQAARTTHKIEVTLATDRMDKPETPSIQQMYDHSKVKHLPGKDRKGNGEFIDWGTKLYRLELELSYKTNEIVVLQKKLQKYASELYPGGDSNKKSVVQSLRQQNENLRKRLATKERQIKWEQKRCRRLDSELATEKKITKNLRKEQTTNHKAVQTLPANHEAVQVGSNLKEPKTRTVMTQCSPTVVKVTNTTKVTSEGRNANASKTSTVWCTTEHKSPRDGNVRTARSSTIISPNASSSNVHARRNQKTKTENVTVENKVRVEVVPKEAVTDGRSSTTAISTTKKSNPICDNFVPTKKGVQFASAMTIKENPQTSQENKDPLEMSITQEFDKDNSVKTMIQSNRDFEIKQKPMLFSQSGQVISGIEHTSLPERLNSASCEDDSGRGSFVSDRGTPSSTCRVNQSPNARVSYKQILDGASPSSSFSAGGHIYERNVPDFMTSQSYSQRSATRKGDPRFNTTAWEIYNRGSPSNVNGIVPYYLFRRSNDHDLKSKSREKPVFVHVSEIMMQR